MHPARSASAIAAIPTLLLLVLESTAAAAVSPLPSADGNARLMRPKLRTSALLRTRWPVMLAM